MATAVPPRKPASRAANSVQRKFADLCARIRRTDLLAQFLVVALVVLSYAFFSGVLDWFADASTGSAVPAIRVAGIALFASLLTWRVVQTIRCWLRPVNPYFVARQIEETLPNAKNSLINWLDLHDEDLPGAFQKNLSARAEEQMNQTNADETVRSRKNWYLLSVAAAPTLGLLVLLVLDPPGLGGSLARAFAPFQAPAAGPRTRITLIAPTGGDAEVDPDRPVSFASRIEGRFPVGARPGAPRLHYRYQASEDYRTLPLHSDDGTTWSAEILPGQIRTGFTYKIQAGDAETPEHKIRVRVPIQVVKYEITYHHKPYRKLAPATEVFPNSASLQPVVHGPPGTEVEMVVRTTRPVKQARVELAPKLAGGEPVIRLFPDEPNAFSCTWTLTQSGRFRVTFLTPQGEENSDRDWHYLHVAPDGAPNVLLTRPEKNVKLAENGTLEIEGAATSDVGVKSLALHLRVAVGPDKTAMPPIPYRPGKSFRLADGGFPRVIEYLEIVALDQLKDSAGTIRLFPPGTVIEYWLEGTDCADVPNANGNVGRSDIQTITLTPKIDLKTQQSQRQDATRKQKQHQQQQDGEHAKANKKHNQDQGKGGGHTDPRKEFDAANRDRKNVEPKIDQALKDKRQQDQRGGAKSGEPQNADQKPGPQPGADQAQKKSAPTSPEQAGKNKDSGDKQQKGGQAKGSGGNKKSASKQGASSGNPKDAPKGANSTAKDAGPKGGPQSPPGNAKTGDQADGTGPTSAPSKNQNSTTDAPIAAAKQEQKSADDTQGQAKGVEQHGPAVLNKDQKSSANPPTGSAKAGKMADADTPKSVPQQEVGTPRGDEPKTGPYSPSLPEIGQWIEQLPRRGENADAAGASLASLAGKTPDPALRDLIKEALAKHGRDPKTGKETRKGPSQIGFTGKSKGIGDDVQAAAVNREFAAKLGQMQLAEWKKQITPDLLKKAGLSDADWQRYLQTMQSYDALVRRLNAKAFRDEQLKILRGQTGTIGPAGPRIVESTNRVDSQISGGGLPPPELVEPFKLFNK